MRLQDCENKGFFKVCWDMLVLLKVKSAMENSKRASTEEENVE